jgi:hypothetical protein
MAMPYGRTVRTDESSVASARQARPVQMRTQLQDAQAVARAHAQERRRQVDQRGTLHRGHKG